MSKNNRVSDKEYFARQNRFNPTYHKISPCPLCGGKIRMHKERRGFILPDTYYTPRCSTPGCFMATNKELRFTQTALSVIMVGRKNSGQVLRQAIVRWNRSAEDIRNRRAKQNAM